jgi:hypothetical protein
MLSGDSSWKGRSASAKPPPVRARPYRAVITSPHALRTPLPAPWTIEERAESFIVRDATGQALGYFYFEDEPGRRSADVRFSNRPFRVKRFQTIHRYSVDVAHGLVLLFGIGTRALPSWGSKTRWNNL